MRSLSLATVFAALSGFVVLIVAGRTLGDDGYTQFAGYWGLFFALTGLLDGLMHETTRGVSATQATGRAGSARPWVFAAGLATATGIVVAATSPWWAPHAVGVTVSPGAVGLMVIGLISYTFQALLSGVLSGLKLWPRYAVLVALDSGIRLVLSLIAWVSGAGLMVFFVLTVIGALSWLLLLRGLSLKITVDVSSRVFIRRVASAMAASGASAALITGFPVMLNITSSNTPAMTSVTLGATIAAVTLTRAPILVPVQRFQSALIVRFVERPKLSALGMPIMLVLAVGLVGALAAWVVGPWLMVKIYGDQGFWVPGLFLAVLTFASACTGSLIITGAAALASEKHALYVTGWIVASVVAFGALALPLALEISVSLALIMGPIAGGCVHAVALRPKRPVLHNV